MKPLNQTGIDTIVIVDFSAIEHRPVKETPTTTVTLLEITINDNFRQLIRTIDACDNSFQLSTGLHVTNYSTLANKKTTTLNVTKENKKKELTLT